MKINPVLSVIKRSALSQRPAQVSFRGSDTNNTDNPKGQQLLRFSITSHSPGLINPQEFLSDLNTLFARAAQVLGIAYDPSELKLPAMVKLVRTPEDFASLSSAPSVVLPTMNLKVILQLPSEQYQAFDPQAFAAHVGVSPERITYTGRSSIEPAQLLDNPALSQVPQVEYAAEVSPGLNECIQPENGSQLLFLTIAKNPPE